MALSEYDKKRKFNKTPEPKGKVAKNKGPLRFVIQKHDATALHYDFRLELDGVLKSWAVPKGPSLKSHEKHLAMMVEDHPYDYKDFEGVIPEGEYGAGNVIIWDEGVYTSENGTDRAKAEKELRAGLEEGHLVFVLNGKKLKGLFALIRFNTAGDDAWLLFKKDDDYVSDKDVTKQDKSVRSGKTVDEIGDLAMKSNFLFEGKLDFGPKKKMPRDVKPMLATLVEEAFDGDEWLFEIKWDGYRAIAEVEKGKVKLYSRNLQSFNEKFAPVARVLKDLKHDVVLDGEVIAVGEDGKPSFQALQDYANASGNLIYYVFDVLYLDGHDLTGLPLLQRKEILKEILPDSSTIKFSEHVEKTGKKFFGAAKQQNLEGIMAKHKNSVYQTGKRGKDWLKIKTHMRQEAVIGGFTEPRASRQLFGSLILGVYEKDKLVPIGQCGGGFDSNSLKAVFGKMKPLIITKSSFEPIPKTQEKATWIKPQLVCEVKFQEWTREGTMRQPIFLGLRPDKKPKQVKRELPK